MKIVLIGYGNVGWHLSRFLKPVCEELMVVTSKPNDKDDFFFLILYQRMLIFISSHVKKNLLVIRPKN